MPTIFGQNLYSSTVFVSKKLLSFLCVPKGSKYRRYGNLHVKLRREYYVATLLLLSNSKSAP